MGGDVSYPRNAFWKDLSYPREELKVAEIKRMLDKKDARNGKINKKTRANNSAKAKNFR
jgi:hypothetical protein